MIILVIVVKKVLVLVMEMLLLVALMDLVLVILIRVLVVHMEPVSVIVILQQKLLLRPALVSRELIITVLQIGLANVDRL